MEKQVDNIHYVFAKYCSKPRWMSYWHQLDEVYNINPKSLLIVGVGDKIIYNILRSDMIVKSLDIADDLAPDFRGSLSELSSITEEKFDCILCCQVLEHLPFDSFEICLRELYEASNKYCVISLPQYRWAIGANIVFNRTFGFQFVIPRKSVPHSFNGEHYWNLGAKGTSRKKMEKIIEKYFVIENKYNVKEITFHRFYVLRKK